MVVDAHVTLCRHACVCMYWYVIEYIMYFSVFAYRSNVLCALYALHECNCVLHNTQTDRAYALRMNLILSAWVTIQGYVAVLIFIVHFLWVVYKLR